MVAIARTAARRRTTQPPSAHGQSECVGGGVTGVSRPTVQRTALDAPPPLPPRNPPVLEVLVGEEG